MNCVVMLMPHVQINYSLALELKYLKQQDAHLLSQKEEEAKKQLESYLHTKTLQTIPNLLSFAIVFVGASPAAIVRL